MYRFKYKLYLSPANSNSKVNFTLLTDQIKKAVEEVNAGRTYQTDEKSLEILSIEEQTITVMLYSKTRLPNAYRSLSGLTRYLLKDSKEAFADCIYNKGLFNVRPDENESVNIESSTIGDSELIKILCDMIWDFTATSPAHARERDEIISKIKEMVAPYKR